MAIITSRICLHRYTVGAAIFEHKQNRTFAINLFHDGHARNYKIIYITTVIIWQLIKRMVQHQQMVMVQYVLNWCTVQQCHMHDRKLNL